MVTASIDQIAAQGRLHYEERELRALQAILLTCRDRERRHAIQLVIAGAWDRVNEARRDVRRLS